MLRGVEEAEAHHGFKLGENAVLDKIVGLDILDLKKTTAWAGLARVDIGGEADVGARRRRRLALAANGKHGRRASTGDRQARPARGDDDRAIILSADVKNADRGCGGVRSGRESLCSRAQIETSHGCSGAAGSDKRISAVGKISAGRPGATPARRRHVATGAAAGKCQFNHLGLVGMRRENLLGRIELDPTALSGSGVPLSRSVVRNRHGAWLVRDGMKEMVLSWWCEGCGVESARCCCTSQRFNDTKATVPKAEDQREWWKRAEQRM